MLVISFPQNQRYFKSQFQTCSCHSHRAKFHVPTNLLPQLCGTTYLTNNTTIFFSHQTLWPPPPHHHHIALAFNNSVSTCSPLLNSCLSDRLFDTKTTGVTGKKKQNYIDELKKIYTRRTNTVRASGIHLNSKQLPLGKTLWLQDVQWLPTVLFKSRDPALEMKGICVDKSSINYFIINMAVPLYLSRHSYNFNKQRKKFVVISVNYCVVSNSLYDITLTEQKWRTAC